MKSFKEFFTEMSLPVVSSAEEARKKILQIAPLVAKGEVKGDYLGPLEASLKAIQTATNPEAYAREVKMAIAAVNKLKQQRAALATAQAQHTTMKPTNSFGQQKTYEDTISAIEKKWKLNEAKPDVLIPRTTKNPKTDATEMIKGGVKKARGNFNKRVDAIGKENTLGSGEVDFDHFKEVLSHISGLASFSRNIDNPSVIGGNEINEFVRSELAKLLIIKELKNPEKDIGVVVKALNLRRPEALRGALMKIKELFKEALYFMPDHKMAEKEIKKVEALLIDFNLIKKDLNRLPSYLAAVRKNEIFNYVLRQMSNEKRYKNWF